MMGGQNQMLMLGGQYEYNIEGGGQPPPGSMKVQGGQGPNALQIGKSTSQGSNQGSSNMPKRTPNSELTSYQSEKRLKEYKAQQQQQVLQSQPIAPSQV